MALTDKLTAIANAIREKTSVTDKLTLDSMPGYIKSITTVDIDTEGIDQGVVDEANRVAGEILKKMSSNSITFIAMSDMHEMGDSDHTDKSLINAYRLANKHAGQGAKLIAKKIGIDFFVNLGDLAWGSYKAGSETTTYDLFKSVETAKSYIDTTVFPKTIMVPGNHDSAFNWTDASGNHIADDYVAAAIGNYQYIDFENKRVRVIALNSAERIASTQSASVGNMTNEQLLWFAEALNLSSKSNPNMWQIIILSHHPFGTKYLPSAANVLQAYVNGSKITIGSESYDFKGKNAAKIVGNFHGHTHCFKVANIDTIPEERKILRIAIPNACNGRNNEYARENNDLVYGEEVTCPTNVSGGRKSTVAGQDTAFCAVTIDLDKQIIYAYCFGSLGDTTPGTHAGYDREISYVNEQTYNITNNLTGASNDNDASIITKGSKYTATISALIDYEIDSIIVTMGGVDITSSAVIGNAITIEEVTGDIVITVTTNIAEDFEYGTFTNLVKSAEERDSTAIYNNGDGYKNGVYPNEAGDGVYSGAVCTGWIPYTWSPDNVLYIKGATLDTSSSFVRIYGFESKTRVNTSVGYAEGSRIDERFTVEPLGYKYYKLTPKASASSVKYIRISLLGTVTGNNLIVTVNEQIHASNGESGDPDVTYTNRVKTSIDTDGKLYNGSGYKTGYRLNSSGAETELSGAIVSGFIPYKNEGIRAYGTTNGTVGNSGNYIVCYNSSFTKTVVISFNNLVSDGATWEQVDGKYILTLNPTTLKSNASYFANAAYIRVSFASMSNAANFVVTLDEPIV